MDCEFLVINKLNFYRVSQKYDIQKQVKRDFIVNSFKPYPESKNMKIINELMELTNKFTAS